MRALDKLFYFLSLAMLIASLLIIIGTFEVIYTGWWDGGSEIAWMYKPEMILLSYSLSVIGFIFIILYFIWPEDTSKVRDGIPLPDQETGDLILDFDRDEKCFYSFRCRAGKEDMRECFEERNNCVGISPRNSFQHCPDLIIVVSASTIQGIPSLAREEGIPLAAQSGITIPGKPGISCMDHEHPPMITSLEQLKIHCKNYDDLDVCRDCKRYPHNKTDYFEPADIPCSTTRHTDKESLRKSQEEN